MTTYAEPGARVRQRPPRPAPRKGSATRGGSGKGRKDSPKRKDPMWAKLCLIIGSTVMLLSGAVVVVPRLVANWAAGDIPQASLIPPELRGTNIDGPINLLLIGLDQRNTKDKNPIRADTIIVAHIPATHDKIFLVSLPRDAEVDIPDFPPTNFRGYKAKINAAFAAGARDENGDPDASTKGRELGMNLTMQTINNLVPGGLTFNGAAIINFEGFRDVLEAVDGVDMCVDVETRSIHFDKNGVYHTKEVPYSQRRIYKVGCRHFTASEALDYARQRHFDMGDYVRQRHQQQLLMAIFKKLSDAGTLTDLGKVTQLKDAAKDLLTLDLNGTEIIDWIYTLKGLRAKDIVMIKTNGGKITPGTIKGNEAFSPESMQLLKSLHDDTVMSFVQQHPDWIAKDATKSK